MSKQEKLKLHSAYNQEGMYNSDDSSSQSDSKSDAKSLPKKKNEKKHENAIKKTVIQEENKIELQSSGNKRLNFQSKFEDTDSIFEVL